MDNFGSFFQKYGGAIIGGIIATVLAFTSFYKYMLAIVFVIFGIWAGNYIQKNKEMLQLFRKYGTKACSKEEYLKVYDYMCDTKIEDVMLEKLSSEELTAAKEKIKELAGLNLKELNSSMPNDLKSYKKMSMLDAYIFHVISKIGLLRNLKRLENEINIQIKENELVIRRSLELASNPLRNK